MKQFEIDIINSAFARCYGLQDAFKVRSQRMGDRTSLILIGALAEQTGLRISFIKENITEICAIDYVKESIPPVQQ